VTAKALNRWVVVWFAAMGLFLIFIVREAVRESGRRRAEWCAVFRAHQDAARIQDWVYYERNCK
jgi:hypothetical protein